MREGRRGETLELRLRPQLPRPGPNSRRPLRHCQPRTSHPRRASRARKPRRRRSAPPPAPLSPPRPGKPRPCRRQRPPFQFLVSRSCGDGTASAQVLRLPARLVRPAGHGARSCGSGAAGASQPVLQVSAWPGERVVESGSGVEIPCAVPPQASPLVR